MLIIYVHWETSYGCILTVGNIRVQVILTVLPTIIVAIYIHTGHILMRIELVVFVYVLL